MNSYLKFITNIANAILNLQKSPRRWKNAIVILRNKAGKVSLFSQVYRPMSLFGSLSKVVEKIIFDKIEEENNDKNIFLTFNSDSGVNTRASNKKNKRRTESIFEHWFLNHSYNTLYLDMEKTFEKMKELSMNR